MAGFQIAARLSEALKEAGVAVWTEAVAFGVYEGGQLGIQRDRTLIELRYRKLILATGTYERPAVFAGNDLPGVMLSTGAQRLLRLYGAHLDTEVTDVGTLGPDAAIEGAPLQQAPEWTFNGGLSKAFNIGTQRLTISANGRYADEQWGTMNERPNTLVDSTTFFDASVSYEFGEDRRFGLTAWGENLTSEKTCYVLGDLDGFTWTNACQPNEGTTLYGVTFSARF